MADNSHINTYYLGNKSIYKIDLTIILFVL